MQLLILLLSVFAFFRATVAGAPPSKIYGVNLGSWLVLEPWMLPEEWQAMGGQICDNDCSTCIASEFAFVEAFPDTADEKFAQHWATWFTQDHVNTLKRAGINTIRLPLGYWIVEALVDRDTEYYPRGGMKFLAEGLKWLRDAEMQVILDHHALPGVQTPGQMFTGRCTSDVQFYTPYNYGRALTWTAVMTFLSHLHPNFKSVFAIEAANEPIMDASKTPGYGDFQKSFVAVVRATELLLGIVVPGAPAIQHYNASSVAGLSGQLATACDNDNSGIFEAGSTVVQALTDAILMLVDIELELGLLDLGSCRGNTPLFTNFMDILWQHNGPNPADAAIGPQAYDHHLYYSFGGVAAPNPEAYLQNICNRQIVQADAAMGNLPLWVGEWSISTQFDATDDFLLKWADAQKLVYSQDAGWLFWNFKIEETNTLYVRQWSYLEGLNRGYLTWDPSEYHDPNVCDPYRNVSSTPNNSTSSKRDDLSTSDSLHRASLHHRRSKPKRHQF